MIQTTEDTDNGCSPHSLIGTPASVGPVACERQQKEVMIHTDDTDDGCSPHPLIGTPTTICPVACGRQENEIMNHTDDGMTRMHRFELQPLFVQ